MNLSLPSIDRTLPISDKKQNKNEFKFSDYNFT